MTVPARTEADQDAATDDRPPKRWGAIAGVAMVAAATALVGPQLLNQTAPVSDAASAAGRPVALATQAGAAEVQCTVPLSITATGMKSAATPVTISMSPQDMSCSQEAAAGSKDPTIVEGRISMAKPAEGTGSCHKFEVPKAVVDIDWTMSDATTKKSSLAISKITWDEKKGAQLGDSTVSDHLAGSTVTAFPDAATIDKVRKNVEKQCETGKENKVIKATGTFSLWLTPA